MTKPLLTPIKQVPFIIYCCRCLCPLHLIYFSFSDILVVKKKPSHETKLTKVTYRSTTSTWGAIRARGSRITLEERISQ